MLSKGMCSLIYILEYEQCAPLVTIYHRYISMELPKKRIRKYVHQYRFTISKRVCMGRLYNLEGGITISSNEVGNGTSSMVDLRRYTLKDQHVTIMKLVTIEVLHLSSCMKILYMHNRPKIIMWCSLCPQSG